jgi:hypothetical protein
MSADGPPFTMIVVTDGELLAADGELPAAGFELLAADCELSAAGFVLLAAAGGRGVDD